MNNNPILPETGFVRMKQLIRLIPVTKVHIYNEIRGKRFPAPIKVGKMSFWRVEDVRAYIENLGKN